MAQHVTGKLTLPDKEANLSEYTAQLWMKGKSKPYDEAYVRGMSISSTGNYSYYYDRDTLLDTKNYFIKIFQGKKFVGASDLKSYTSPISGSSSSNTVINIDADLTEEGLNANGIRWISGSVVDKEGNNYDNIYSLSCYYKTLTSEIILGTAIIRQGDFSFVYQLNQLPDGDDQTPMRVKAMNDSEVLAQSPLFFNVPAHFDIKLVTDGSVIQLPSEFKVIKNKLDDISEYATVSIATFGSEGKSSKLLTLKTEDIAFLSKKTDLTTGKLQNYIQAEHHALSFCSHNQTKQQILYALFSNGIESSFEKFLFTPIEQKLIKIQESIKCNVIDISVDETLISQYLMEINDSIVSEITKWDEEKNPLKKLFFSLGFSDRKAEEVLKVLVRYAVDKKFRDSVDQSNQTVYQAISTTYRPSSEEELKLRLFFDIVSMQPCNADFAFQVVNYPNLSIKHINQVAENSFYVVDWAVDRMRPAPEKPADKKSDIKSKIIQCYPYAYLNAQFLDNTYTAISSLQTFLTDNPTFSFCQRPVKEVLMDENTVLRNFSTVGKIPLLEEQLTVVERMLSVVPLNHAFDDVKVLLNNEFDSAMAIVKEGANSFFKKMNGVLSDSNFTYKRAETVTAQAVTLWGKFSPVVNSMGTHAFPAVQAVKGNEGGPADDGIVHLPTITELFGAADYNKVAHTDSVFGPSAYFADLLSWLKKGEETCFNQLVNEGGDKGKGRRRPDLIKLLMDSANSDTVLPHIDLVNEILEREILAWNNIGVHNDYDTYQTTRSERELAALPEHQNDCVYDNILKSASYPWSLPFNLAREELISYLNLLGVKREELVSLMDGISLVELNYEARESRVKDYFGFNSDVYDVFNNNSQEAIDKFYPELALTDESLLRIRELLNVTGLAYEEFKEILKTKYVGFNKSVITQPIMPDQDMPFDGNLDNVFICNNKDLQGNTVFTIDAFTDLKCRLYKFVVLKKSLGWSNDELDHAIMACGALNAITAYGNFNKKLLRKAFNDMMDLDFLERLIKFHQLSEQYQLSMQELASWVSTLLFEGYSADETIYQRVFNDYSLMTNLPACFYNENEPINFNDHDVQAVIQGGLGISSVDLNVIVAKFNFPGLSDFSNHDILSIIYRVVSMQKALHCTSEEFLDFCQLYEKSGEECLDFFNPIIPIDSSDEEVVINDLKIKIKHKVNQLSAIVRYIEEQKRIGLPAAEQTYLLEGTLNRITRNAASYQSADDANTCLKKLDTELGILSNTSYYKLNPDAEQQFCDIFTRKTRRLVLYLMKFLLVGDERVVDLLDNYEQIFDEVELDSQLKECFDGDIIFSHPLFHGFEMDVVGFLFSNDDGAPIISNVRDRLHYVTHFSGDVNDVTWREVMKGIETFYQELLKMSIASGDDLNKILEFDYFFSDYEKQIIQNKIISKEFIYQELIERQFVYDFLKDKCEYTTPDNVKNAKEGLDISYLDERDVYSLFNQDPYHTLSNKECLLNVLAGSKIEMELSCFIELIENAYDEINFEEAPFDSFKSSNNIVAINGIQEILSDKDHEIWNYSIGGRYYYLLKIIDECKANNCVVNFFANQSNIDEEICRTLLTQQKLADGDKAETALNMFSSNTRDHGNGSGYGNEGSGNVDTEYYLNKIKVYLWFNRAVAILKYWGSEISDWTIYLEKMGDVSSKLINLTTLHVADVKDGNIQELYQQFGELFRLINLRKTLFASLSLPQFFELMLMEDNNSNLEYRTHLLVDCGFGDEGAVQKVLELLNSGNKNKIENYPRIHRLLTLHEQSGLSIGLLQNVAVSIENLMMSTVNAVRQHIRQNMGDDAWLKIAPELRNELRIKQRNALRDYLLMNKKAEGDKRLFHNENDLYEYYLIDPEMAPCAKTSRLKQATLSIQLFVQRILLNLEEHGAGRLVLSEEGRNEWEWRKNYRVWEANRKVFFYPENWLQPELRAIKSPFFKELEDYLTENGFGQEMVDSAYRNYLEKLSEVASLEVMGLHKHEADLYVVARTQSVPHSWYYRIWQSCKTWTPWEKVDVDIDSDCICPVFYNDTFYIFWPKFRVDASDENKEIKNPINDSNIALPEAKKQVNVSLAFTKLVGGIWKPAVMSKDDTIAFPSAWGRHSYDDYKKGDYLLQQRYSGDISNRFLQILLVSGIQYCSTCDYSDQNVVVAAFNVYTTDAIIVEPIETDDGWWSPNWRNSFSGYSAPICKGRYNFNQIDNIDRYKNIWDNNAAINEWAVVKKYTLFDKNDVNVNYLLHTQYMFQPFHNTGMPILAMGLDGKPVLAVPVAGAVGNISPGFGELTNQNIATVTSQMSNGGNVFGNNLGNSIIDVECVELSAHHENPGMMTQAVQNVSDGAEDGGGDGYNPEDSYTIDNSRYHFISFDHPWIGEFCKAINKFGFKGVLAPGVDDELYAQQLQEENQTISKLGFDDNTLFYHEASLNDEIDFSGVGAYGLYNWELFFHAPMYIADALYNDKQYEAAQKWLHYIFDPTNAEIPEWLNSGYEESVKFWRLKPFVEEMKAGGEGFYEELYNLSQQSAAIQEWEAHPFDPHTIAKGRVRSYMKSVLMKYLDNLIAWGDMLFAKDTMESINEAAQLYIMAAQLLGRKPVMVDELGNRTSCTFDVAEGKMDNFSNLIIEIENRIKVVTPAAISAGVEPAVSDNGGAAIHGVNSQSCGYISLLVKAMYFGIPANERFMSYWEKVGDRLFKIRNCMNLQGVKRTLALYAPPIDPGMLVAANAAGVSISTAITNMNAVLPKYRYSYMHQKAVEYTRDVQSLGQNLLSALEKRDAEALAQLRSGHALALLDAAHNIKEQAIDEAQASIEALEESMKLSRSRITYFKEKKHLNSREKTSLRLADCSAIERLKVTALNSIAGFIAGIPDSELGIASIGPYITTHLGGSMISRSVQAGATLMGGIADAMQYSSGRLLTMAGYDRRQEEWDFSREQAEQEVQHIQKQILSAQIRKAMAERELENHKKQMAQSAEDLAFMKDKYTNKELYKWMVGELSTLYQQSFELALKLARTAERAVEFELGKTNSPSFIGFNYWESLKQGLLAGEKLHFDLKRLEMDYMESNARDLEITRNIPLSMVAPQKLIELQQTGQCSDVVIPEILFDMDYPGHYMRRIKTVNVTIPAVTGPYTPLNCMLSLTANKYRKDPTVGSSGYASIAGDTRFVENIVGAQSIAVSSGQNDSGMFEFNFNDSRYLPFEGAGAISRWNIEFPDTVRQFDYKSISDVILTIRYTAKVSTMLKHDAENYVKDGIEQIMENVDHLMRPVSLKAEHSDVLYGLNQSDGERKSTLAITGDMFPYVMTQIAGKSEKKIKITNISIFSEQNLGGKWMANGEELSDTAAPSDDNLYKQNGVVNLTLPDEGISLDLEIQAAADAEKLDDVIVVLDYKLEI